MSKITESARGEQCHIRMPGICNFNPETTVWCHGNGSAVGKGLWMKAHDILGAYGCFACHQVYDRQVPTPVGLTRTEVELMFWEGHARSIVRLIERGLIVIRRGVLEVA